MKLRLMASLMAGILTASCSGASSNASAATMTAEETVAFILFGVKDESSVERKGSKWTVIKERAAPLMLSVINAKYPILDVHVKKIRPCMYTVVLHVVMDVGAQSYSVGDFDLSNLTMAHYRSFEAEPEPTPASVRLDKVSLTCSQGCTKYFENFQNKGESPFFLPAIADAPDKAEVQAELTAAVTHFRENICKSQ